jgi:hypothetical protein
MLDLELPRVWTGWAGWQPQYAPYATYASIITLKDARLGKWVGFVLGASCRSELSTPPSPESDAECHAEVASVAFSAAGWCLSSSFPQQGNACWNRS